MTLGANGTPAQKHRKVHMYIAVSQLRPRKSLLKALILKILWPLPKHFAVRADESPQLSLHEKMFCSVYLR